MALNPNPSKNSASKVPAAAADESTSPRWLAPALEIGILVLGIALVMLVRLAWLETAIVTSGSMEPTLRVGDRLLVDHRASLAGSWERGEIIVFESPSGWSGEGEALIKRLVAIPGDSIEIRNGGVVLNGTPLSEPYLPQSAQSPPPDMMAEILNAPPRKLGPGEYWVMGDNRWNSDDSRTNGPLPGESINGRMLRILLPWDRRGVVE